MATARNVGMVLGVGMAGAIFTTVMAADPTGSAETLYKAIDAALLAATIAALLGALASFVRGSSAEPTPQDAGQRHAD